MRKIVLFAMAAAMASAAGCTDNDVDADVAAEASGPPTMDDFAGRWVFNQTPTQSKYIELSSDGTYSYVVTGAPDGMGMVYSTATGTWSMDPNGSIKSVKHQARSPVWTGVRNGNVIDFSLNGEESIPFKLKSPAA